MCRKGFAQTLANDAVGFAVGVGDEGVIRLALTHKRRGAQNHNASSRFQGQRSVATERNGFTRTGFQEKMQAAFFFVGSRF